MCFQNSYDLFGYRSIDNSRLARLNFYSLALPGNVRVVALLKGQITFSSGKIRVIDIS